MAFEIGDKVLTNTGLYMTGAWREAGLKGKVVATPEAPEGRITVKFKGIEIPRFMDPSYVILRGKKKEEELDAPERERPFAEGDSVALGETVYTTEGWALAGADAEVVENIPNSNLVRIEFLSGGEATISEDALSRTEVVEDKAPTGYPYDRFAEDESKIAPGATIVLLDKEVRDEDDYDYDVEITEGIIQSVDTEARTVVAELTAEGEEESYTETLDFDDFTVVEDAPKEEHSPEVLEALNKILSNIEEIKTLLTTKPQTEFVINVHPSAGLSEEEVAEVLREEEPAPEPVFKKAKNVKVGDLLYTEGGAYDKVTDVRTKDSGYTSLFGSWGNRIAQVPSGRVVQVLEEVK